MLTHKNGNANEESGQVARHVMSQPSAQTDDLLARVRTLSDPLRNLTWVTIALALFSGLMTWPASGKWAALGTACSILSFAILITPHGRPNAIYLRAFRTDPATAALRAELAVILGPGFRLSGIRPPREKSSLLMRVLAPGWVALKYAGSKFMELEAGDDWMARLWKTYQSTRIVLIDVRDMTEHVHAEVQLTLDTMGEDRCVFLVGEAKTEAEWRQELTEIVGQTVDAQQIQLLDVRPGRVQSGEMAADLRQILTRLPEGVPGVLERGRQFVLDHVSEDLIRKSGRTPAGDILGAIFGILLLFVFGLVVGLVPHGELLLLALALATLLPTLVLLAGNVSRAVRRARRLRQAGFPMAAAKAWSMLALALVLFLANPLMNALALQDPNAPFKVAIRTAHEASAIQSLRTLATAEVQYSTTYPGGFACSLAALGGDPSGAPTAGAAQLISGELAAGRKAGYSFRISECDKTKLDGQDQISAFRIVAVPDVPGTTGSRGFCMDESMELKVDRSGGTNCTEPLQ